MLPPTELQADPKLPPRQGGAVRQELLRQLVEQNVALREGRPAPAGKTAPSLMAAARAEGRRPWVWATALAALGALVLGAYALRRPAEVAAPALVPASEKLPAAAPRLHLDGLLGTPLAPIDPSVLGLQVRRIVVDPGHGGHDTGTTIKALHEKDLTLDIGRRLRERLEAQGFEVVMTREDDTFVDLAHRSEMANREGGDLFVSIHINWLPKTKDSGVETYFVGTTEDPRLMALAQKENANSGVPLSDYRAMLEGLVTQIATEGRQDSSRSFAARIQQSLFNSLRPDNPELINRGVKSAPFVVLVGTEMPAILAEVACLSSDQDAAMLARPLYRESIADALSRGIRRYADDVNPAPANPSASAPATASTPQKGK